jgi:hypothetical protein
LPRTGRSSTLGKALLTAFLLNLVAVAILVVCFYLSDRSSAPVAVSGKIFVLGCLHAVVGCLLATWLLFVNKNRLLFSTALFIQLLEVGSLATVLLLGPS